MELLGFEDFKDTNVDPKWTTFDYLLEVTRVDQEKLEQRSFKIKKKNGLKRKHQFKEENSKNKRLIKLFFSNVNFQASQFLIPFSQLKSHEFLNEFEIKYLKTKKDAIKAHLLDPSMEEIEINFNKWLMGNSSMYIVTTFWNSIVKNNQLEVDNVVQLWSFRVNSTLCFALRKL
ncbi:hypothetical protein ES288_D05G352000v1 [Gossypium darwinii]|uniref:TF-B3 domain-containing protein n=1 Tax=Gossypium darwinii TaxID=34276 RepID=A0A5D2CQA0_GOSDA|nr:hypothetical protein ES288_D05G352000v1 [Gossypium darwinii]